MQRTANARRVAARYASRLRYASMGAALDLLARLQVLEGAAGVDPGTFSAAVTRGATTPGRKVLSTIMDIWPALDPSWVSPKDQGVVNRAWVAADKLLSRNPHWSADDLVMTLLEGRSPKGNRENLKKGAFYMIGGYNSTKNGLGRGYPAKSIYGHAAKWGKSKAVDLLRDTMSEFAQHGDRVDIGGTSEGDEGSYIKNSPSTGDLLSTPSSLPSLLDELLHGTRAGRQLNGMLVKFWGTQGNNAVPVMQGWVDGKNNREISKAVGVSEQHIGRMVKKLAVATADFLKHGKVRDLLDELLEVAGRGLGHSAPRYAGRKVDTESQVNKLGKAIWAMQVKVWDGLVKEHHAALKANGWKILKTEGDQDAMDFRYHCTPPADNQHPSWELGDVVSAMLGGYWTVSHEAGYLVLDYETTDWRTR